jgi:mannose-1-phosphate guanylyltransferase
MLEEAVRRIEPVVEPDHVFIATSSGLRQAVEDSKVVPPNRIFAEPDKRNTLGALVWTTAQFMALFPETWMPINVAVVTADHKIRTPDQFRRTVETAMDVAEQTNGLVTIGIPPTRAETGFGYIEIDPKEKSGGASRAKSFREKPTQGQAEEYVSSGRFLWNSGMFFWTLAGFHRELEKAQPKAAEAMHEIAIALTAQDDNGALEAFRGLPNISIDHALMENAQDVYVVPAEFHWDDVGSWDALLRSNEPDANGNHLAGNALAMDTKNSIIVNDSGSITTAVLGMEDVIVVTTEDAVLVCPKSRAQEVKRLVEELRERGSQAL